MIRRRAFLLLLCIAAWIAAGQAQAPAPTLKPTVILISFDGWRWDYAAKYQAPNVRRLIARGVSTPLIPSFPSKTFPNHYTIITGLYPGHHGVVANAVKDPPTGRRLTMSNTAEVQDPMWWGGEPLWVTVQRAGQVSAAMFWPGSEAPILGQRPRLWRPYEETLPGEARVDIVLDWLDLPEGERPTLITLYFSEVDGAGHDHGPDSRAVREAVRRVDGFLGRLLNGLERRRILDQVNVVVVSDHGMAESTTERVVVLDDYISLDDVEIIDLNPTLGLYPPPEREDAIYHALANAHPRLKVYRRAETPEHWQFRNHPRIPPIVGVVDEGWQIMRRSALAAARSRGQGTSGVHGYDPDAAPTMQGVLVAAGPAFKVGATVPAMENVHVYEMLAAVLGVTPAANDGDAAVGRALLR